MLAILSPMWLTINRTARETRSRIERVLSAAKAKGHRSGENPAMWRGNLKELLPRAKRTQRHHPAAPYKDVPGIVRVPLHGLLGHIAPTWGHVHFAERTADQDVTLGKEYTDALAKLPQGSVVADPSLRPD